MVKSIDTAGRAVLFAGTTVVIAVMGLFTIGLAMVRGLAVGISLGVLFTMLAALTLLPAVLGFVGNNIDRLGLPWRRRGEQSGRQSIWYRWSKVIQRHPWPAAIGGAVFLVALTIPVAGIRLGFADASNRPTSDTTRQAFDLLSDGFGPGSNGPFILAADVPGGEGDMAVLDGLVDDLRQTDGVAQVSPPIPNDDGTAAIINVVPTTAPQAKATETLVHTLRDDVIPRPPTAPT